MERQREVCKSMSTCKRYFLERAVVHKKCILIKVFSKALTNGVWFFGELNVWEVFLHAGRP